MVPPRRYASASYFSSFIFKALPLLSSALSSLMSWMWALVTDQPPPQTGFPWGGMLFCLALLCLSALLLPHSLTGSNPLISLYEIGLVVNPSMPKAQPIPGPSHLLWPCL